MNRINKEIEVYNYKPITETFYRLNENHYRIQKKMNELLKKYSKCENSGENCESAKKKINKKFGKIIFLNK